jgi:hypothetical protein
MSNGWEVKPIRVGAGATILNSNVGYVNTEEMKEIATTLAKAVEILDNIALTKATEIINETKDY